MITKDISKKDIKEYFLDKSRGKIRFRSTCPHCSEDRRKKTDKCVSVDIKEGTILYQCQHCKQGGGIDIKETAKEQSTILSDGGLSGSAPVFSPPKGSRGLGEKLIAWFATRGISDRTAKAFRTTEGTRWFRKANKERIAMEFNYYQNDELVNSKYRSGLKEFAGVANGKLTLFGHDLVLSSNEMLITEGELDAMAAYESGYLFSTSVPNGASDKGVESQNLSWMDELMDTVFKDKKKIYIAVDADKPGRYLEQALVRRLGAHRCYLVKYPEGLNDLNKVLMQHGKDSVKQCIRDAKEVPLEGIVKVSDRTEEVYDLFINGADPGYKLGVEGLDDNISFRRGDLICLTGIPGNGKSNFVDFCMIKLAQNYGMKFGVFSFEKDVNHHILELCEKLLDKCLTDKNGATKEVVEMDDFMYAMEFINDHFYFVNASKLDSLTPEILLSKGEELVYKYGIDFFIVDNASFLEMSKKAKDQDSFANYALNLFIQFKSRHQCGIIVVAHPRKSQPGDKQYIPNGYSISGSAAWFNKVDFGWTAHRDPDDMFRMRTWKCRFNWRGKLGDTLLEYDMRTGNYKYAERTMVTVGEEEVGKELDPFNLF